MLEFSRVVYYFKLLPDTSEKFYIFNRILALKQAISLGMNSLGYFLTKWIKCNTEHAVIKNSKEEKPWE